MIWFAAIAISAVLVISPVTGALAHGGGLDSYGCHHNRKAGGYHCHRGPLAGSSFGSQAEMLERLKEKHAPARPPAQK